MNITEQKKENDVQWYAQCFSYQAYLLFQVSWKKRSRCIGGVMSRGVTRWGKGGTIPRAPNHCGGRCKVPAMSQVVSSIQLHLFPKDLRFEHGGAKLSSGPGRLLTSLRPWLWVTTTHRSACGPMQNRRQKVINRGALRLCGGAWHSNLINLPLIYNASFSFAEPGALFGGINPPKPPRGDGTEPVNCF